MLKNRRQLRRSGFTLIELLAASMLAALLAVGILRVVSSLARTRQAPPRDFSHVVDVLRRDFVNARSLASTSDGLSLVTYDDSPHRHEIAYGIVTIANHRWLIRRDSALDTLIPDTREELIAPDVAGFSAVHPVNSIEKLRIEIRFVDAKAPPVMATFFQ